MKILLRIILLLFFLVDTPSAMAPDTPRKPWQLPDKEIACLATIIHHESRGEPVKGQAAVLQVVFTRMKKRGLTACEVMKEHKQFSFYRRGVNYKVTMDMIERYRIAAEFGPVFKSEDVEYFHTKQIKWAWSGVFKRVGVIGNHIFYQGK